MSGTSGSADLDARGASRASHRAPSPSCRRSPAARGSAPPARLRPSPPSTTGEASPPYSSAIERAELACPLRHVRREPVDRRALAEDRLELVGRSIAAMLAASRWPSRCCSFERAGERLLHRHLLVEHEPDQERQRALAEEGVRLGVAREVDRALWPPSSDAIRPGETPGVRLQPDARVVGRPDTLGRWTRSLPSHRGRAPGSSARSRRRRRHRRPRGPSSQPARTCSCRRRPGSGKTLAAFLTGIDRLDATPGRGAAPPLRLAAEGAQLRRRAQPARPARRARLDAHGRRAHRRHRPARAPPDAAHAARHPDHDARVALPPPHLAGPGDAARRRDRDRRRGARRRRDEARRAPRALARAARARRRAAVPADRPLRDAAAARGDRALRRRRPADRARRRGHPQGARPRGRRRARGHARAGLRLRT